MVSQRVWTGVSSTRGWLACAHKAQIVRRVGVAFAREFNAGFKGLESQREIGAIECGVGPIGNDQPSNEQMAPSQCSVGIR